MKDLSGPCQVYVFFVKFRPSSVKSLPGPSGALPSRLSASWFVMRPLSSSTARASSAFTATVYLIKAAYWNPATASTTTRTMRPMRFRVGETFFLGEPVAFGGRRAGIGHGNLRSMADSLRRGRDDDSRSGEDVPAERGNSPGMAGQNVIPAPTLYAARTVIQ